MILKLTKYSNTPGTFEAVWTQTITLPQQEISEGVADLALRTQEVVVRCTAYSGDQVQMFRDDVTQYGGDISEWESLIAEVEAEWVPPPAPPAPVITSVTMRQARLALLGAGLLDDVDAAIQAITDPVQRKAAEIEWEYAQTVDRDSAFTQQLAGGLNLTAEQLDSLFTQAAAL